MNDSATRSLPDNPMDWDDELVLEMLSNKEHPVAKARAKFYHHAAALEQADAQRKPPTAMKRRRMEFIAALDILKAYGVKL